MKEKQIYMEGYKKPYPEIQKEFLPKCTHQDPGLKCTEARLMKAGVVNRGEQRLVFQDVRMYFEENK